MPPASFRNGVYTTRPTGTSICATARLCSASSAPGPVTSKIANADRSTIPTRSRIARCSALMIGDHQRDSHSASRGITRSPYSSSSGAFDSVPVRPLPADRLEEDGPELPLARVERAESNVAVRGPLLHRVHDAVGLVEPLRRASRDVGPRPLVRVEPRDVGAVRIDLGLAVGHPLGDRLRDPGRLLDPDRGGRPQPADLGRLAEDRRAVGRERQQSVDRVPDARPARRPRCPGPARAPAPSAGRSRPA